MEYKRTNIEGRVPHVSPFLDSFAELERHVDKAHALRARASMDLLGRSGRAVAGALPAVWAPIVRWQRARQTHEALMRCSDRVLADIGIKRDEIALVARGIDPHAGIRGRPGRTQYGELRLRLSAALRRRRQWRRVTRELMAYQDRELDEIGIRRSEIPDVARGRVVARATE